MQFLKTTLHVGQAFDMQIDVEGMLARRKNIRITSRVAAQASQSELPGMPARIDAQAQGVATASHARHLHRTRHTGCFSTALKSFYEGSDFSKNRGV